MGMRVGAFELYDPVPQLTEAQALVYLSPWIDAGEVGSQSLRLLEARCGARDLGKLQRPGTFYDFTRYRPTLSLVGEHRQVEIPNTFVTYSQGSESGDMVFFHCLEPHAMAEEYVESTIELLNRLNIRRYCLIGGMYDAVPHTRPQIVTGATSDSNLEDKLREANVKASQYEGPTTINVLISEQAPKYGIATMILLVHLPNYVQVERDYKGQYTLLSLLCYLFNLSIDLSGIKRQGEEQYRELSLVVEADPRASELVKKLEAGYDGAGVGETPEPGLHLSPEIEKFLREMEKRFGHG